MPIVYCPVLSLFDGGIAMIAKLTKNNRRVNWYVRDKATDFTRSINGFEEWSTGDFDKLLAPKRSQDSLLDELRQKLQQQGQGQQQQQYR